MNWNNASFVRKVIYLVGIAVLLLPIAAISQPATAGPHRRPASVSPQIREGSRRSLRASMGGGS